MKVGNAICIHKGLAIKEGEIVSVVDEFEVRIMAIAEGYAMVRRKRCMPFICSIKDLRQEV
jgi:hypothetical protein